MICVLSTDSLRGSRMRVERRIQSQQHPRFQGMQHRSFYGTLRLSLGDVTCTRAEFSRSAPCFLRLVQRSLICRAPRKYGESDEGKEQRKGPGTISLGPPEPAFLSCLSQSDFQSSRVRRAPAYTRSLRHSGLPAGNAEIDNTVTHERSAPSHIVHNLAIREAKRSTHGVFINCRRQLIETALSRTCRMLR